MTETLTVRAQAPDRDTLLAELRTQAAAYFGTDDVQLDHLVVDAITTRQLGGPADVVGYSGTADATVRKPQEVDGL